MDMHRNFEAVLVEIKPFTLSTGINKNRFHTVRFFVVF